MAAVIGSLRAELSASVAQFQTDLGKAADSVKDLSRQFQGVANDFKKVGNQIQSIGLSLSKTLTLPLVGLGAAVTKVGIDFEDAFAGVEKTVGGVVDSLGKLTPAGQEIEQAFRDLAKTVPTSAAELAKIGETAGQLGVGKENVVAFAKTIAEIGAATHLSTEEAATDFAKLAVVMKVPQSQFESLGSAVYALGNFGSSTEQEMLGMATRISKAGATVGLTTGQVLGLSNALSSAGIEVESGGTAMSKLIILMAKAANDGGKQLKEFAKVAGETSDEFKKQFQTDAAGAIVSFVEGLGKIKDQGGNLLGTIEKLGITNSRLRDSTLGLALAGDLVRKSVDLGTQAFADHTAFLQAVQVRYRTTSNELKILGNQITDVGITLFTALKPAIETAIRLIGSLLPLVDSLAKSFAGLPGGVQLAVISFLGLSAALGPLTYLGGQVITSMGTLVGAFGKTGVATRGIVGALSLGEKALQAFNSAVLVDGALLFEWGKGTVAVGGIVGRLGSVLIGLANTAFGPLAAVVEVVGAAFAAAVSPIGLIIAGIAALALGVIAATGHWSDFTAAAGAVWAVVKDLAAGLWYLAKTVVTGLVTSLIELSKWIGSGLIEGFKGLLTIIGALAQPFIEFGVAINDSINNLGGLGTALKIAGVVLIGLANPVAGVVAGLVLMVARWDDLKAALAPVGQVIADVGTVLGFLAQTALPLVRDAINDAATGFVTFVSSLASGAAGGIADFGTAVVRLTEPLVSLAKLVAGPVVQGFQLLVDWITNHIPAIPAWMTALIDKATELAKATRDLAVKGAADLHDYAQAIREFGAAVAEGFQTASAGLADYRKSITDRALPTAALEIGKSLDLLKSQLKGISFNTGGSGFADLVAILAAARAELAALSKADLSALTQAVQSGAFSMKELQAETGLSEVAIKLFQDRVRENAKDLKASNSIFDEFKKKVAELTTALTEAAKFNAPVDFIRKQFKTLVVDVVEDAAILGKQVPKVIQDGFLQITLKDAADHMVVETAKFGKMLNDQVKADLDKRNDQIIKALGASVDAQQQAAEAASQFSIQGLANEIKNLETVYGETKKSIDLKKQLYAEEYLYQVELLQKSAQAEKDGLDKKVGDYTGAYARIDAAVAAKVGLLSQNYQQKLTEMRLATKKWQDSLSEIASIFSDIASSSSGSFASVVKEIGNLVSAFDRATKAAKEFQVAVASGSTGGKVAAIGQGVAAVAQATSSKNPVASVAGGAIAGGQLGATIGSIVPGIGTAIGFGVGAGVGALVGYIRAIHKGAAEKAALDVGRDFGINISDGLAKELADMGKVIGRQAANIFDLDKIIAEGGGLKSTNIQNFTKKLHDTFSLLGTGALTAADATHVLDSNFANFANYFLAKGPLISKDLVDIVKLTREWGLESQGVTDFIAKQIDTNIIPGLARYTDASKNANDKIKDDEQKVADLKAGLSDKDAQDLAKIIDLKKKMAGADAEHAAAYQEQIDNIVSKQSDQLAQIEKLTDDIDKQKALLGTLAVTSEGAAQALAATVLVAFNEMQKAGKPMLDIVAQLAPIVDQLGQQFDAAGFSGGAAFEKLRGIMALASDEIAGPAIDAATGLGQALAGLSNIGDLDQSTFTGLSDQIAATFDSLGAQGKDGNQVLALMKGPLQTIWQLQQEFGYSVDAATQALLDQAVAAGIVGEKQKPIQEQMLDATKAIAAAVTGLAKVFGVDLPEAGKTGADKLKDEFEKLNPKVKVDIQYNDPGFTPDVSGPTGASTGGLVTPMGIQHFSWGGLVKGWRGRGTDTVPAMLTPGEVVLNRPQQDAITSALAAVTGMSDIGSGGLGVLQGRAGVVTEDQIAAMRKDTSRPVDVGGGDTNNFSFSLYAYDASGLQRLVTKPGGLADVLVTATSQGKRGLDEKLRRALRVPG